MSTMPTQTDQKSSSGRPGEQQGQSTQRNEQQAQRNDQQGQSSQRNEQQAQQSSQRREMARSSPRGGFLQRRGEYPSSFAPQDFFRANPFSLLRRMTEEIDRMFQDSGLGREDSNGLAWSPAVEVSLRDGKYNIHAELPGLDPKDVRIEVENDALVIQGERRVEREDTQGGVQRTERQYGLFYRSIPLPEGAKVDQAKAQFHNGVLEISIPVPEQQNDRRSIPIEGGSEGENVRSKPPQSQAA
jgi:HSP20 family protein